MPFEKGHNYGVRFSVENQPSSETKSAGWRRRRVMRDVLGDILEQRVVKPEDIEAVRRVCPQLGEDEITPALVMVTNLVVNALDGDLNSLKMILRILGEY